MCKIQKKAFWLLSTSGKRLKSGIFILSTDEVSAVSGFWVAFHCFAPLKPWLSLNFSQWWKEKMSWWMLRHSAPTFCQPGHLQTSFNHNSFTVGWVRVLKVFFRSLVNVPPLNYHSVILGDPVSEISIRPSISENYPGSFHLEDKQMLHRPSGSEHRKRHWRTSLRPLCYLFFTHIDDASFTFNCSPSQECLNRDLVMEEFWDLLFNALWRSSSAASELEIVSGTKMPQTQAWTRIERRSVLPCYGKSGKQHLLKLSVTIQTTSHL